MTAITHRITCAVSSERLRKLVARSPVTGQWILDEIRGRYPESGLVP